MTERTFRRLVPMSAATIMALGPLCTQAADEPEGTLESVIVTGSRIRQTQFDAPTPTTSVSADAIELSGTTNLTNFLANQPALAGSMDSTQTSGSEGFIGSTGLNLLNLRNLGTERTLVLVDGRRHVAQLPDTASVDVNTIPTDLIERVDIVTGGVSAVYGADAVSGVVNFVMKKDFEGLTGRFQYGSAEGGEPTDWHAAITGGFNFADGRGNLSGSIEHTREGRLQAVQRDYLSGERYTTLHRNPDDPDDDPDVPDYVPLNNIRYFDTTHEGSIDLDFDGFPEFLPDGSEYQIDRFVEPFYTQGGSGTLQADYIGDLLAENETTVVSGFLNYQVTDAVNFFADAKFVKGKSFSISQPTFDYYLYQTSDNPFLTPAVAAEIIPGIGEELTGDPAAPDGVSVSRDNFDLGLRGEDIDRETIRAVVGINGDLSADYRYEVAYVYGQSEIDSGVVNNRYSDRFLAAIDVVADPVSGEPTCRSNLDPTVLPFQPFQSFDFSGALSFTPGPDSGCLPLNIHGDGVADPEAIAWVMFGNSTPSKMTQNVFTGYVSGPVPGIALPGGPIDAVVGVEWRRETSRSTPPEEDQLGLTWSNVLLPSDGDFDVKEAFVELRAPLLEDAAFADTLSLSAALRLSDYSTVGSTTTWNAGLVWAPIRDVSFRATVAESVRAPNIGELFSPQNQTFNFIDDPCDVSFQNNGTQYREQNCATVLGSLGIDPTTFSDPNAFSIGGIQQGNADLSEETARSYTYGVVLRPSFAPRLIVAIDYYDINIEDAISTAEAQDVADNCVDQPTLDNVFCDVLSRDPTTGAIDGFVVQPENVAAFRTRGIDFEVNYALESAQLGLSRDIGNFGLTLAGNHLDRLTTIPTIGAEQVDDRGTIYAPEWQTTLDLTWHWQALTINYGFNYFDETTRFSWLELQGDPDSASRENIYYDARETHDLSAAFDFLGGYRVYAGVNNLTDQRPDLSQLYPVSPVGRFFYAGFKASFGGAL
jgi:iron complex outermembrane recepter protein